MKKSQLKQLIKEIVQEVGSSNPYPGSREDPERIKAQKFAPIGSEVEIAKPSKIPTRQSRRDRIILALAGARGKVTAIGESDWIRHVDVKVPELGPKPISIYVTINELRSIGSLNREA